MFKKILFKLFVFIFCFFPVLSFADLSVKVPQPSADEVAETSSSSVESDTDFWVDLMQTATRYGWVFLVVIAFGVLLYGWFLLMASQWEDEEMKKWNRIITYTLIGFIVALFSYMVIKLVINLF